MREVPVSPRTCNASPHRVAVFLQRVIEVIRCRATACLMLMLVGGVHAEEQIWEHLCATAASQSTEAAIFFTVCEEMRWSPTHRITPPITPSLPQLTAPWDFIARAHLAEILLAHAREEEAATVLQQISITSDSILSPHEILTLVARCAYLEAIATRGEQAITQFEKLVEQDSERVIPRRHRDVIKLLAAELEAAQNATPLDKLTNSLDAIRRQLERGATGQETQQQQEDAIKTLQQIINSLEGELAQQEKKPTPGAIPAPHRGAGNVTDREIPPGGDWGGLPPKEREEALNKIQRDFPALYRDLIEAYFRDMARESTLPSNR